MIRTALLTVAALASTAASAPPVERPLGVNARIPFADANGIRNFKPDGRDAIYIQDQRRRWYRGEFIGPCSDLPFATAIGFETRGTGSLDKFSRILVRGRSCQLNKLVTSAPPPSRKERARRG